MQCRSLWILLLWIFAHKFNYRMHDSQMLTPIIDTLKILLFSNYYYFLNFRGILIHTFFRNGIVSYQRRLCPRVLRNKLSSKVHKNRLTKGSQTRGTRDFKWQRKQHLGLFSSVQNKLGMPKFKLQLGDVYMWDQ